MNKKIIIALMFLASSTSYAQEDSKKIQSKKDSFISELPSVPKLDLPKIPSFHFPTKNTLFYNYSISVEKLSKDNTAPIMLYKSNGNGVSENIVSYSTLKHIPYIKECNTNKDTNELKCSSDTLSVGWGYTISSSSAYDKAPYEFLIRFELGDILGLKNSSINMIKNLESREIRMSQSFYYKNKKETFVFKSYGNSDDKESDEYIFTVTIDQNKQ